MRTEYLIALLLASLVGYLTYVIFVPFIIPIFWAIVLVILFYPYYRWLLNNVTRRSSLASVIACLTIAVFLILPMALIGAAMANELFNLYEWAEQYIADISSRAHKSPLFIFPWLERFLGRYIDVSGLDLREIFATSLKEIASFAGQGIKGFVTSFAQFVFHIILAFFSMYFLFKEGDRALNMVKNLLPLSEYEKEKIFAKNRDVISSTIYGGVLVGLIQGALGGIAFWFLGLPAPIVWGFVMFLFSFLPSVGSAMIWGPVVVYFLISGAYMKGLMLFLWGTFVIGLVDNLLRPIIVSGKTAMHPLLLFFSILGAVNVFGFIGIIAGPLILSIALSTVELYQEYLKKKNTWEG